MGFCARAALFAMLGLAAGLAPVSARADSGPVFVVPGRADVPVIINGVDARGAVVTGDWGLFRAGHGYITIDGGNCCLEPLWRRTYFPMTGREPAYGRLEIEPHRSHPRPSTAYHKSWSTSSEPGPVTDYPPFAPPPVIVAPRIR